MRTIERYAKLAIRRLPVRNGEFHALGTTGIGLSPPIGSGFYAICLYLRRDWSASYHVSDLVVIDTCDQTALFRHNVEKAHKRRPHMLEIPVDIGMIELDGGHDRGAWPIVQKLRSFIKISAVVLIPFNHHVRALAQSKGAVKIAHDRADEHVRITPGLGEHPGDQGRGGAFAMRASDHHTVTVLNKKICQSLRK